MIVMSVSPVTSMIPIALSAIITMGGIWLALNARLDIDLMLLENVSHAQNILNHAVVRTHNSLVQSQRSVSLALRPSLGVSLAVLILAAFVGRDISDKSPKKREMNKIKLVSATSVRNLSSDVFLVSKTRLVSDAMPQQDSSPI